MNALQSSRLLTLRRRVDAAANKRTFNRVSKGVLLSPNEVEALHLFFAEVMPKKPGQ